MAQVVTHREMQEAIDEVVRLETLLLINAGWKYSSDYPDSCWRWSITLGNGRTLALSRNEAIAVEEALNPDPEDEDDDGDSE